VGIGIKVLKCIGNGSFSLVKYCLVHAMANIVSTPDLVLKLIKRLKRNSSAGPDCIPAKFYKETGTQISFVTYI